MVLMAAGLRQPVKQQTAEAWLSPAGEGGVVEGVFIIFFFFLSFFLVLSHSLYALLFEPKATRKKNK